MPLDPQYGAASADSARRNSFDSDAANYDRVRPRYCPELFAEITRYAALTPASRALEIGPDTGQATEPFIRLNCRVTAVELGRQLADYLAHKYEACAGLRVWCGDFLAFPETERYDLIYSATAFHWIPREQGLAKARRLLREGGTLALFWNHPTLCGGEDTPMHRAVQRVYDSLGRSAGGQLFDGSSCAAYEQTLRGAGFCDVRSRLFTGERVLTGRQYVQLMRSYSDHQMLAADRRERLERDMEAAIRAEGDALPIRDVMDLYLARKG